MIRHNALNRRSAILSVAALATTRANAQSGSASGKLIRIVVPFAAGGVADATARAIAPGLAVALGQQVIVDNVTGAGGRIGTERVASSAPDGTTLLLASTASHVIPFAAKPVPGLHPVNDFAPVGLIGANPLTLLASRETGVRDIAELVRRARSRPGAYSYGSAGVGTSHHLVGEMFKSATGLFLVHLPYRGEAQAVQDLLGGQINLAFVSGARALIDGGRVSALGITSPAAWPGAPDIPTIASAGYPDVNYVGWNGLFAAEGTDAGILERLNHALNVVLAQAQPIAAIRNLGFTVTAGNPTRLLQQVRNDLDRFSRLIQSRKLDLTA